jgi:hypothetical protein
MFIITSERKLAIKKSGKKAKKCLPKGKMYDTIIGL